MTDFYDGPRGGVADFDGWPHVYKAERDYNADDSPTVYALSPISDEVFQWVLEQRAIHQRWEAAFLAGRTPWETHFALPEENARYEELDAMLSDRLVIDPSRQIRAHGNFRVADDPEWKGPASPLEVQWEPC